MPVVSTGWLTIVDTADLVNVMAFKRSQAQPATPNGVAPAGWTVGQIPSGTDPVWASLGKFDSAGNLIVGWQMPELLSAPETQIAAPPPAQSMALGLTFADVPDLPESNPGGIGFRQTDWLIDANGNPGGWRNKGTGTLTVEKGNLVIDGNNYGDPGASFAPISPVLVLRARQTTGSLGTLMADWYNSSGAWGGSLNLGQTARDWRVYSIQLPSTAYSLRAIYRAGYATYAGRLEIDWCWLGVGNYEALARDVSPTKGRFVNTQAIPSGPFGAGKSLVFNGATSRLYATDAAWRLSGSLLLSFLVNVKTLATLDHQRLVSFSTSGSTDSLAVKILKDTGVIEIYNGTTFYRSAAAVTAGVWAHIAIGIEGATLTVYKDAVAYPVAANWAWVNQTDNVYLGARSDGTSPLNGQLAMVGLWKNLTPTQGHVYWLYQNGALPLDSTQTRGPLVLGQQTTMPLDGVTGDLLLYTGPAGTYSPGQVYKFNGSAFVLTTATEDAYQLGSAILAWAKTGGTTPTGWTFAGNLVADAAFINSLQATEIQFEKSVGSTKSGGAAPTVGDLEIHMGLDPRRPNDPNRVFEFAISQFVGQNGLSCLNEEWRQLMATRLLATAGGGTILALLLAGCLQTNSVISQPAKIFTKANYPFTNAQMFHISHGDGVWIASGNGGLRRSQDNGATWGTATSTFSYHWQTIYAGGVWLSVGEDGLTAKMERSTNGGASFSAVTLPTVFSSATTMRGLAYVDGVWVAAGGFWACRSVDNGLTWTQATIDTQGQNPLEIEAGNGVLLMTLTGGRIARSVDKGVTWTTHLPSGVGSEAYPVYGGGVWIARGSPSGSIIRSLDGGVTWSSPIIAAKPLTILRYCSTTWAAVGGGYVSRSNDLGLTWSSLDQSEVPDIAAISVYHIGHDPMSQTTIIAGKYNTGTSGILLVSRPLEAGAGVLTKGSTADGDYRCSSDGIMEAWGKKNLGDVGAAANHAVTFPKAFDAPPNLQVSYYGNRGANTADNDLFAPTINTVTTTGFSVFIEAQFGTTQDVGFFWRAIGQDSTS